MKSEILIVDDSEGARALIKDYLGEDYYYFEAEDMPSCFASMEKREIDLVILDLKLPGVKDFQLLIQLKKKWPHIPVVILTSHADYPKAIEATRLGAEDFIPKDQAEHLLQISVNKTLCLQKTKKLNTAYKNILNEFHDFFRPTHPIYASLYAETDRLSRSELNYLLLGETGVGKDVLAHYIHQASKRSGPLVRVDCGELDMTFLKSDLFGHEKGAFTGAEERRIGKFELADGGTLFLDEIGNMSLELQTKFLTVIEKKSFQRLGGNQDISVDFRVVAATNLDLQKAIEAGKFRGDLFYRINEVELTIPSLREVKEAIPQFVAHFIEGLNTSHGSHFRIDDVTLGHYLSYAWPGNIRELKAKIKKDFFHYYYGTSNQNNELPETISKNDISTTVQMVERINIEKAFKESNGNITKAAENLSLKRQTLQYKLKKYGIQR